MDDLYDINFESNGKFYKIYIRYNSIDDLCTIYGRLNEIFHIRQSLYLYTQKKRQSLYLL
jgi:hypothetical protein